MVKVYSKESCFQCTATTKEMDRKGISYEIFDIAEDEAAFQVVKELGYKQAPVVVAGDDHWSGFRPDKINSLVVS